MTFPQLSREEAAQPVEPNSARSLVGRAVSVTVVPMSGQTVDGGGHDPGDAEIAQRPGHYLADRPGRVSQFLL